ncbi:MAG: hypothetical protein AB7F86_08845 [Bdellovibrionales bacterium]
MDFVDRKPGYSTTDLVLVGLSLLVGAGALFMMQLDSNGLALGRDAKPVGTMVSFAGEVRTRTDQTLAWRDVQSGEVFTSGQSIYTGENSGATIKLVNQSEVRVEARTLMVLDFSEQQINVEIQKGAAQLTLSQGGSVNLIREGQKSTLTKEEHPEAVRVEAQPSVAEVSPPPPPLIREIASVVESVNPPTIPKEIEMKIELSHTDDPEEERPIKVSWRDSTASAGFELQVSKTADFKESQSYFSALPEVRVQVQPEVDYFVRVRSLKGFEVPTSVFSPSSHLRLHANFHIRSPELVSPQDSAVVSYFKGQDASVFFQWQPVERINSYDFQILDSNDQSVVFETTSTTSNLVWRASGKVDFPFLWRVRARKGGSVSDWSPLRTAHLKLSP